MRCFLLVRYFLMFYWMSEVGPTCFAAPPRRPFDQGKKKKTEAADAAPHQSRVRFCGPGPREELVHQAQGPVVPTMLTSANKAKNRLSFCEPGPPEELVHQAQGTPCMPTSANKAKKNGKSGETTFVTKIFMKWFYPRLVGPARLVPPRQRRSSPPSSQGVTRETVKLEAPVLKPLAGHFSCPSQETNEASTSQQRDAPHQRHAAASCEPGPRDDVVHRTEEASASQQRDAPRQRHVRFAEQVKREAASCEPGPREETVHQAQGATAKGKKKETEAVDAPHQSRVRFCGPGPREELVHQAQGPVVPTMLTSANKAKNRLSFFTCFAAPFTSHISSSKKAELVPVKFEAAEVKKDASCSQHSFCEPGPQGEVVDQAQGSIVPTASSKEATALNAATCSENEELEPPVPDHNKGKKKKTEAADAAPHQSRVRFCGPGPREELAHQAQGTPCMPTSANKEVTLNAAPKESKIEELEAPVPDNKEKQKAAASCEPGPRDDVVHRTEAASTSQQRDAPRQRHVRFAEQVMVYSYDVSSASSKPKFDGLIPLARESEIEELEAPVAAHRQQNKAKRHVSCFFCFGAIDIPSVKREATSCEPGPREETVHQAQGARAKAKKNGKSGETTFITKIFKKWFYPRLVGPARLAPPRQRRSSPPSSQGVTRETVKLEAPVLKPLAGHFSCPSQETNEASTSQQRDAPHQRHVRFAE